MVAYRSFSLEVFGMAERSQLQQVDLTLMEFDVKMQVAPWFSRRGPWCFDEGWPVWSFVDLRQVNVFSYG